MSARNDLKKELRKLGYPLRTAEVLTQEPTGFQLYLAAKYGPPDGPGGFLADLRIDHLVDLLIESSPRRSEAPDLTGAS